MGRRTPPASARSCARNGCAATPRRRCSKTRPASSSWRTTWRISWARPTKPSLPEVSCRPGTRCRCGAAPMRRSSTCRQACWRCSSAALSKPGRGPTLDLIDVRGCSGRLARPALTGGRLHGLDDFRIGGTAAQIARQIVADAIIVGVRMLVQQLLDHQHEAGRTETALERAVLNECLLDRVEHVVAVEVFNRLHHGAVREGRKVQAARDCAAVDDQGAAPAQSLAAALAGAIETEIVAHHFEQAVVRGDLRRNLFAVEREGDGAGGSHAALRTGLLATDMPGNYRVTHHHASANGRFSFARNARSRASGLSGNSVSRTPMASSMALPMAGDTQKVATSPTPLPPNGPLD